MQDKEYKLLFKPLNLSVTAVFLCSVFAGTAEADNSAPVLTSPEEFSGLSRVTAMLPEGRYAKRRSAVSSRDVSADTTETANHRAPVLRSPSQFPEHFDVASRLPESRYARKPQEIIQQALLMHPVESKPAAQQEYAHNLNAAMAQNDKIEVSDIHNVLQKDVVQKDGAPAQLSLFPSLAPVLQTQEKPAQTQTTVASSAAAAAAEKTEKPVDVAVQTEAPKAKTPVKLAAAPEVLPPPVEKQPHNDIQEAMITQPVDRSKPNYYDNFFNAPETPRAKFATADAGIVLTGKAPSDAPEEAVATAPVDRKQAVAALFPAPVATTGIGPNGQNVAPVTLAAQDIKIERVKTDGSAAVLIADNAPDPTSPIHAGLPPVNANPVNPTQENPPIDKAGAGISPQSKAILEGLPQEKKDRVGKQEPVNIEHVQKNSLEDDTEVKKHNGVGIHMSVKQPKANISRMLEDAYDALVAGDQQEAIRLYKQVLATQPANKLALFGLATTYHRAGQIQLARPLYGKLLAIDPSNVEGLNNFLVLLSDEDPRDALGELGKLEKTHPGFSPIPAQMAVIYEKIGDYNAAAGKMNIAIELSPEDLKYRYNMAIILDKKGDWVDAANFYQQLLTAHARGEKISANPEEIQQRLTFILSNKTKG